MAQIDRLDGGIHTARVSAAVADRIHREQQQADALAYLTRTGNTDIAEILGLVRPARRVAPPPAEVAKPKPTARPTSADPGRQRKGCPSEAQQRRHRQNGEECAECTALVRRVNAERKYRARQRRAAA